MRFVSLEVESFKAIKKAAVSFGPGLNVVFGPNDLGKSTLAAAIQAALLVLPSSTEASDYSPWYADATPRVKLTFADDQGRYWRVQKSFGGEQKAELFASKDGKNFSLDCKGREVDGKLRDLLGWGISPPGGRGGPKGLPVSFLSQALLAPQTDVDAILGKSLADDAANTGKLRLNKALATLAQDPVFKQVLDRAQGEVDQIFTPTWRIKKSSQLAQASEAIKKVQAEVVQAEQELQSSKSVQQQVNQLRDSHAQALEDVAIAKAAREEVQRRLAALQVRSGALQAVEAPKAELAKIDAAAAGAERLATELKSLEAKARKLEQEVAQAQARHEAAGESLHSAEEALRAAKSEDGARQRALQKAQLEARASELRAQLHQARGRQEKAEAALKAAEAAQRAEESEKAAAGAAARAQQVLSAARAKVPVTARDMELARATLAYGRWRVATSHAADAAKSAGAAATKTTEAETKDKQVAELARSLAERRVRHSARQAKLPSPDELKALDELERALRVAEAALGGGVSVAVRSRGQTAVRASVDGEPAKEDLPATAVVEAQRTVKLTVGKTVEIEVTAGSPESRRAVDRLRDQWAARGAPALERAAVTTMAEVLSLAGAHSAEQQALALQDKELERLRSDVAALRDQARQLEQQGAGLAADPTELARMKSLFGAAEEAMLARTFASLGRNWEAQAEGLATKADRKHQDAKSEAAQAEQAAELATYKSTEATKTQQARAAEAAALAAALGGGEPKALLQAAQDACATLAREEAATAASLRAQEQGASAQVAKAEARLQTAKESLASAGEAVKAAVAAKDAAQAAFHARAGELSQARQQLVQLDRPGAEKVLADRQRELAMYPLVAPTTPADLATAEDVAVAAERTLEKVKQELHTAEGALSKVGGSALAEEVARLREALDAARSREKDLQVDADAWRLLQETLRQVENEEGAHLGRALAQPLAKKFGELTGGRYEGLRIDPALKTEALGVAGANTGDADVVMALSVGTRDQLATLVRLTIAEQLKTAIVLDDQLVHTDPSRLRWFVEAFLKTALEPQVIVLTCQAEGYLEDGDLSRGGDASWDVAGGRVRVVDATKSVERFEAGPQP